MEELIIEKVQEELGVSDYVLSVSKRLAQQLPGIIVKYRKPKENPQTFKINLKRIVSSSRKYNVLIIG